MQPDDNLVKEPESDKKKYKMTVWVDFDTYTGLNDCKAEAVKREGRAIRPSQFIEDNILKPYLARAREDGTIK